MLHLATQLPSIPLYIGLWRGSRITKKLLPCCYPIPSYIFKRAAPNSGSLVVCCDLHGVELIPPWGGTHSSIGWSSFLHRVETIPPWGGGNGQKAAEGMLHGVETMVRKVQVKCSTGWRNGMDDVMMGLQCLKKDGTKPVFVLYIHRVHDCIHP